MKSGCRFNDGHSTWRSNDHKQKSLIRCPISFDSFFYTCHRDQVKSCSGYYMSVILTIVSKRLLSLKNSARTIDVSNTVAYSARTGLQDSTKRNSTFVRVQNNISKYLHERSTLLSYWTSSKRKYQIRDLRKDFSNSWELKRIPFVDSDDDCLVLFSSSARTRTPLHVRPSRLPRKSVDVILQQDTRT